MGNLRLIINQSDTQFFVLSSKSFINMKQKILITAIMLLSLLNALQAQTKVSVTLLNEENIRVFQLANEGVEIKDSNVKIHTLEGIVEMTFEQIKSMTFESNVSGINELRTKGFNIWSSPGTLHISTPRMGTVQIFNLSGILVKNLQNVSGETKVELPQGMYLLKINSHTVKTIIP